MGGASEGAVPIRRLVAAHPDRSVAELMIPDPVSVRADADQEEVAKIVARYDLLAVPVTALLLALMYSGYRGYTALEPAQVEAEPGCCLER